MLLSLHSLSLRSLVVLWCIRQYPPKSCDVILGPEFFTKPDTSQKRLPRISSRKNPLSVFRGQSCSGFGARLFPERFASIRTFQKVGPGGASQITINLRQLRGTTVILGSLFLVIPDIFKAGKLSRSYMSSQGVSSAFSSLGCNVGSAVLSWDSSLRAWLQNLQPSGVRQMGHT